MSLRLHVQTEPAPLPRRQGSPTPAAHELLFEDDHPPMGWQVFFAVDPVTQERIASAWCRKDDDPTLAIDWLQQLAEHHLAQRRGLLRRAD